MSYTKFAKQTNKLKQFDWNEDGQNPLRIDFNPIYYWSISRFQKYRQTGIYHNNNTPLCHILSLSNKQANWGGSIEMKMGKIRWELTLIQVDFKFQN